MADQPQNLDAFFLQPSTPAPVAAPPPAPAVQPPPAATPPAQAPPPPSYQPQFASSPPGVVIPPAYQTIETPTPAPPPPVVTPPVAAPPPAPVVPAATQPTAQQVSDALAAAQQLGIDTSRFTSGADLVQTMWATVQEMNREIEQQRAQYQQMQAQYGMQTPPAAPQVPQATPEGFKWDMPQYDPAWDQYPDDPGMQAAKRNYIQARNKTADRMLSQFPDLVKQVVAPELEQARAAIREQMQQEIQQYRYDQQVEALESRLTPHLYQSDLRGQRTLTPWGQQIIRTVEAYRAQGVQDPLWIMQQAEALVGPPPNGQQPPAAPAQLPVAAASPQVVAQPPGAPTAGMQQPQSGGFIPGTNYRVMPVTTMQIRAPDGTIVSPNQLSEQQKASFLQQAQAARATHVPQVGTTPADIQSRPVTEADLNTWFLQPTQG
jgi:hypothetical protein